MAILTVDICGARVGLRLADRRQREDVRGRYRYFLARRDPAILLDTRMGIDEPLAGATYIPRLEIDRRRDAISIRRRDFEADISFKSGKGRLAVADRLTALDSFFRTLYTMILLRREGFLVHAAGLKWGRSGYLFPGVSGAGKTTLARMAGEDLVLSDEITGVRRARGKWKVMGTPFWGEFSAGKLNAIVPLKGIFFLDRRGKTGCRPIAEDEAAARLLEMTLFFTEDIVANRRLMAIASRLVRDVPVFELSFRRDTVTIDDVMNIVGESSAAIR